MLSAVLFFFKIYVLGSRNLIWNSPFRRSPIFSKKLSNVVFPLRARRLAVANPFWYSLLGMPYWVCPIGYSLLGIPDWVCPIGYSLLGIPYWVFPLGYCLLGTPYWVCPVGMPYWVFSIACRPFGV